MPIIVSKLLIHFSHVLTFSRSHALLFLLLISCTRKNNFNDETFRAAVEWMWSQQSPDGGWHSQTHAVLRDGRVLTPYILFHLMPLKEFKFERAHQAVRFIVEGLSEEIDENRSVQKDYPNYSAAYALRILHGSQIDTPLQRTIAKYLIAQQFDEDRGFTKDSLAYGGWGFGENLKYGEHGHVDISHTRRVVEALVESGFMTQEISEKVRYFLKGIQRDTTDLRKYKSCQDRRKIPYDGGFIASVVTMNTIKSRPVEIVSAGLHYPSYATATCDAFMTMHVLGMQETVAYNDAKKWLKENQNYSTIDGLKDHPEQWDEIMHYYHLAVRAEAMSLIEPDGAWKESIKSILLREQLPEGYFVNPIGGVNKEDDPLMATILSIQACNMILGDGDVSCLSH